MRRLRTPRPFIRKSANKSDPLTARVNELAATGRRNWLSLLAYLAFVFTTVLAVTHADFFVPGRSTHLPLVNVGIPTKSFFLFAPIVGASLYIYLHLHIPKISEAITTPAPITKNTTLESQYSSWLLIDYILRARKDDAALNRRMDWLADISTVVLVWLAGPLVLATFWWRSMPAHNQGLTLTLGACLLLSLYAGFQSWHQLQEDILKRTPEKKWHPIKRLFLILGKKSPLVLAVFLALVSWLRTEGFTESAPWLAPINLTNIELTSQPENWIDARTHGNKISVNACIRAGIPMSACNVDVSGSDDPRYPHYRREKLKWCDGNGMGEIECNKIFDKISLQLREEWPRIRKLSFQGAPMLNLRDQDLRRADFSNAVLHNVDLSGARLHGANFRKTDIETVRFFYSDLNEANFTRAFIHDVNFVSTSIEQVVFDRATLRSSVIMFSSSAKNTSFIGAKIHNSYLFGDSFEYANFSDAIIRSSMLNGDFSDTVFNGVAIKFSMLGDFIANNSKWDGAQIDESLIYYADFTGANLMPAQISSLVVFPADLIEDEDTNQSAETSIEIISPSDTKIRSDLAEPIIKPPVEEDGYGTDQIIGMDMELKPCWKQVPPEIKLLVWGILRIPFDQTSEHHRYIDKLRCPTDGKAPQPQ